MIVDGQKQTNNIFTDHSLRLLTEIMVLLHVFTVKHYSVYLAYVYQALAIVAALEGGFVQKSVSWELRIPWDRVSLLDLLLLDPHEDPAEGQNPGVKPKALQFSVHDSTDQLINQS